VAIIGAPSPPGGAAKVRATLRRVRDLRRWALAAKPDVALSHNSYAQIVAAKAIGIPAVTAMDYEHQPANHVAFRLANCVLLPEAMRSVNVRRLGASPRKTQFYPGLKEEIYLGDFDPDPAILEKVGIDRIQGLTIVLARTPPSRAIYHQFGNPLFLETLRLIGREPHTVVVVLVRYPEQRSMIADLGLPNCVVPEAAVDSRSLLCEADVVIGAGGTMTREAALLGARTYGVYAGRSPAVDRHLEQQGRLIRLTDPTQLLPLRAVDRPPLDVVALREAGVRLVDIFVRAAASASCGN
jgi:predicted glycosyltransferase